MEGTVKWFNNLKNFGFITPSDGGKDVFVHRTGLKEGERITENDKVSFDVKDGERGPQAINVAKLKSESKREEKKVEKEKVEKKEEKKTEKKPAKKKAKKD